MPSTTDSELRVLAQKKLDDADALTGQPSTSAVLGADDFWSDLADRAKKILEIAIGPSMPAGKIGSKVRDAMKSGLDTASEASDLAREKMRTVAIGAGLLALTPLIVPVLIFLAIEGSGFGGRARRAGSRYGSRRARDYGC